MSLALASLFVEFGSKGDKETKGAMGALGNAFGLVGKIAATATAAVGALVAAGLVGTHQGERFGASMKHFSETIASLFLPVINTASDLIREFSERLSASTGAEKFQSSMRRIADLMNRAFEVIVPIAIRGFELLADIVTSMVGPLERMVTLLAAMAETPLFKADMEVKLLLLKSVVDAIADLMAGDLGVSRRVRETMDAANRGGGIDRVTKGGGMEGIQDAYKRLQQAVLKDPGSDWAKRSAEAAEKQLEQQKRTNELMDSRLKPPVGP